MSGRRYPDTKQTAPIRRPTVNEFLESKKSMMGSPTLPAGYGLVETTSEALKAAIPPPNSVTLRMHIIWDNDIESLNLERVLEHMRETGAAMVIKVEQVT